MEIKISPPILTNGLFLPGTEVLFRRYRTIDKANGVPTNPSAKTNTSNEKNEPDIKAPLAENKANATSKIRCREMTIG